MQRPPNSTTGNQMTIEEMFPVEDRWSNFNITNPLNRPEQQRYGSMREAIAAIRDRRNARANELYQHAINNTQNGRINMNSPYIYGVGQQAPLPPGQTAMQPQAPSAPPAMGGQNPFAAAAMQAGLNDAPAMMQSNQAAALRSK